MIEITRNIFIGTDCDCASVSSDMAIIHACKTCHQKGVGYNGNLPSNHPNYLILEKNNHLYLNMVDMERELLPKFTNPIMRSALNYIEKHLSTEPVLLHCNQGVSRSPSIGLVYLAKKNEIANASFVEAKKDFLIKYPPYNPGRGIELYLQRNWDDLMEL